jgi:hypothetical protein
MALTLVERVEIVLLSGRQGWCILLKSENYRLLCYCRSQYVEPDPHKHGKATEKMRRCRGEHTEHIL